ncbi:MAG TPA: GNAT family N-acetyltransferase [Anaerolineales bacterium]|nr:GNAT family N-acetyltransferase [Anaerolineales bacterium]
MDEVIYRLAEPDDLPVIAGMYAQMDQFFRGFSYRFPEVENIGEAWVDSFRRTLGRFSVVYIAELEGNVVGFMLGRVKRVAPYLGGVMVGELSDMWVEPEARRLGVGKVLSLVTMQWLAAQGVHSIEVQILEGNEPIWRLYEKMGFKPELRQIRMLRADFPPEFDTPQKDA